MDANDRRAIQDLFDRLRDVERRSPPRDPEAEALIGAAVAEAPAAPYYMAQTIVVQKQALEAAERRIGELENAARQGGEGFLSGLFGTGRSRQPARRAAAGEQPRADGPWNRGAGQGGFLAGAAQTAMGVAGGILLGNMIAGAFSGGGAEAAESRADDNRANDASDDERSDDNPADGGSEVDYADSGDFGGDF